MVKERRIGLKLKGGGVQENIFSLKTKDKVRSNPSQLTQFEISVPLTDTVRDKVESYTVLHKKDIKNLTKLKSGEIKVKKVFEGTKSE